MRQPVLDVHRTEWVTAHVADDAGLEETPAELMTQEQLWPARSSQPAVSPLQQGHNDGKQIEAFLSEDIFICMRLFRRKDVFEYLRLHQASEPNFGRAMGDARAQRQALATPAGAV